MRSTGLLLCIFALAWGLSNGELTCYSCQGKDDECPHLLNESNLPHITPCGGVLSTVCTKISIEYPNGDYYTYRNCAPSSLEYGDNGMDFCSFIEFLYTPFKTDSLINHVDCVVCNSYECNT
ncbi:uncharacterized protein LOC109540286 [Dendroctonus ponderosae]